MNKTTVYCYRTYAFIFTLCHILHHSSSSSSSSSSQFGALSTSRPTEIVITNHSFIHQEVFHSLRFQRHQYHQQHQHKKHRQQQYHNEQCSYRIDDVTTTNNYFSVVDSLRLLPYRKYSILPIDWMLNNTATTSNSNSNSSDIDLNIIIMDPSRYEVLRAYRYQQHIPQMMTLSDSLLLTGLVNNTMIGSVWFQQKRASWVLPLTHRRQNRTSCYQAILKASSSLPTQLYQPIQTIYPWYMIIVTYAIVHPTGALALSCGLYQPLHSCDTHDVFNEDFKSWYQRCFFNMTQYMHHHHNYHNRHHHHHHHPQQQMLTYNSKKELMVLVWNHFYHHIQHNKNDNDIKYGTHVGFDRFYHCNIEHINYYPSIFLATGYGDTNYYHFMITDLLRLIRAIPWLQKHTDIFIHIGHLFDPTLLFNDHHSTKNDYMNNRFLNMNMQSHILQYFGIDKSRIVTGIVFGKVIYIPRPIRCDEHEYHSGEIRMLSDIMIHMASLSSSSSFPNSDNTNNQIIDIDDDSNNHHDDTIITRDTIHNVDDRSRGSIRRSGSKGSNTRISSSRSRGGSSSRGKVNQNKRYLLPIYKKSSTVGKKDLDYDHHHDHHHHHQKNDLRSNIDKNRLKRMKRNGSIKPLIVILARINDDDKRMIIDGQGIRTFTTLETVTLARKMKQLMIDHRVIVFNESVLPRHQHYQHHNSSSSTRGSDNFNDSDRNKNRIILTTSSSCLTCRINTFMRTSILVSVHGAGLVNLIFMKPSTLIVEIVMKFTPVALPYCGSFGRLAHVMNIHHLSIYYDSIYHKSLSTTNITQHIVNKIHYMWYEHVVRQHNGNNSNNSYHHHHDHHQQHHDLIQRVHKMV